MDTSTSRAAAVGSSYTTMLARLIFFILPYWLFSVGHFDGLAPFDQMSIFYCCDFVCRCISASVWRQFELVRWLYGLGHAARKALGSWARGVPVM